MTIDLMVHEFYTLWGHINPIPVITHGRNIARGFEKQCHLIPLLVNTMKKDTQKAGFHFSFNFITIVHIIITVIMQKIKEEIKGQNTKGKSMSSIIRINFYNN